MDELAGLDWQRFSVFHIPAAKSCSKVFLSTARSTPGILVINYLASTADRTWPGVKLWFRSHRNFIKHLQRICTIWQELAWMKVWIIGSFLWILKHYALFVWLCTWLKIWSLETTIIGTFCCSPHPAIMLSNLNFAAATVQTVKQHWKDYAYSASFIGQTWLQLTYTSLIDLKHVVEIVEQGQKWVFNQEHHWHSLNLVSSGCRTLGAMRTKLESSQMRIWFLLSTRRMLMDTSANAPSIWHSISEHTQHHRHCENLEFSCLSVLP
jgi:hypothetical protein